MPRTNRQNIILRHDQILRSLEKSISRLSDLHDMFAPHHPQYAVGYENIIYMLAQAHEFVEKMKEHV
jgi:benzoyl-CoA reductase/2-hydroxyglutaryl-CoA dehydratase subunit BcrC/BadD/HgdB